MSKAKKGIKLSEEHKIKVGLSQIGNKNNLGKKLSKKWKENMSKSHKGKRCSEETKIKLSLLFKGKPQFNNRGEKRWN